MCEKTIRLPRAEVNRILTENAAVNKALTECQQHNTRLTMGNRHLLRLVELQQVFVKGFDTWRQVRGNVDEADLIHLRNALKLQLEALQAEVAEHAQDAPRSDDRRVPVVVLEDGETWQCAGGAELAMASPHTFRKLEEGVYPKSLRFQQVVPVGQLIDWWDQSWWLRPDNQGRL